MGYNYNYIFPKKADAIKVEVNKFKCIESDKAEEYKNAVILPVVDYHDFDVSHGRGGVVDSSGNYVKESFTKARVKGSYEVNTDDCQFIDKKVVYCGYFHKAWGHYITEAVSRLWYVLKNDTSIDNYVFIDKKDENSKLNGNYLMFLELLGIKDKVIIINQPTRFSSVVVPENGFVYGEHFTKAFADMYKFINKKGLELYKGPSYEKVYFSKNRIPGTVKANLNVKFIDKYFKKNGYEIFYPENLSLVDTIGIMQNCKCFCALSSSLAHNQLFGHSNQTMISIEKQAFYNPYQIFVGNITGCEVVFVDACRHIFPVGSAGPFLYEYTDYFKKFSEDYNLTYCKPMSNWKYRKMFKKYMVFYFDLNNTLPPDYMYRQSVIEMSREMYDDTIAKGEIFHMSLYNRIIVKIRRIFYKSLGPY